MEFKVKTPQSWDDMDANAQSLTIKQMRTGGSFCANIADALNVADRVNAKILSDAFHHLICKFQPEEAKIGCDGTVEKIGAVSVGGFDRDDYLLVKLIDEGTMDQVKLALEQVLCIPNGAIRISVREGVSLGEFIAVVHYRYD